MELVVENYAVIERVRVRFHRGLNVLTGETGSGKSIVVDALGLLFGGRSAAELVRSDAKQARISGIFEAPDSKAGREMLDAAGVEVEQGELVIEREILASGKSRAFMQSKLVTAALLRELAPHLGDIHGQHDQQQLFSLDAQREMLDAFAADATALSEVAAIFTRWRRCSAELEELGRNDQEKLRLVDLWSFQRKEIDAAGLKPEEDAELENERRVLRNVARLQESATGAFTALFDSPESVSSRLRIALRRLEEVCRIDETFSDSVVSLKTAEVAIDEVSRTLRDYVDDLEANPARLEDIENRLATIDKLKRKYGGTVAKILEFLDEVSLQLSSVENAGERKAALEKEQAALAMEYRAAAANLTGKRKEAARQLTKRVEAELAALAMERSVFRVQIEPAPWSLAGADAVQFLLSANVGEEPKPLEKVASGGELSRVALALRTCAKPGAKSQVYARALVFDEVDAGVGGSAAEAVARRLKKLAASNQVLCVTHLAQIAGFADHHYTVEKHESKGRTVASIEELAREARPREIARMLSGHRVTPEALRHAEQLIELGLQTV